MPEADGLLERIDCPMNLRRVLLVDPNGSYSWWLDVTSWRLVASLGTPTDVQLGDTIEDAAARGIRLEWWPGGRPVIVGEAIAERKVDRPEGMEMWH